MWDSCVWVDGTFRTIPTVRILRGRSFFVPAQTLIAVKLLSLQNLLSFVTYRTPTKKPRILHITKFLRYPTHHKYLFIFTRWILTHIDAPSKVPLTSTIGGFLNLKWRNLSTAPGNCMRRQQFVGRHLGSLQRGDSVWWCCLLIALRGFPLHGQT